MNAATTAQTNDVARGILESFADGRMVLSVPGTKYKMHLVAQANAAGLRDWVGKRVKGRVHANALRLFKASAGGGGCFVEPLWGEPRIIAGLVEKVDQANRRVLVNVVVPMWLTLEEGQRSDQFAEGDMVNCYVQSGATFSPA